MRAGLGVLGEQPVVLVPLVPAHRDFKQLAGLASSSNKMPALPPSITTGRPFAVVSTGLFCRSQSYRSCGVSW